MIKEDFFNIKPAYKQTVRLGDRVRFLNSTGGGIVTAFHGKNQALVQDEDGFEIPVLISECVVTGEAERRFDIPEPQPEIRQPEPEKPPVIQPEPFVETPQGEILNISIAFLPVEPTNFMNTPFETYLINESNYYLYAVYMSGSNNSWRSRWHGLVEPDSKIFIEEVAKQDLNELEHLCIQIIAFKQDKPYGLKRTVSVEMRPDTVKFYKLHCFTENDFFEEDALVLPVVVNDIPEKKMLISATDIRNAMSERKRDERRQPQTAHKKPKPDNAVVETDLHINQLLDSTTGMSNADMLNYQMEVFHRTMKKYLGKSGQKMVFIHGKGDGVLRAAIEKELKSTYKQQCTFQDASFKEYGFGATMVTVHRNNKTHTYNGNRT